MQDPDGRSVSSTVLYGTECTEPSSGSRSKILPICAAALSTYQHRPSVGGSRRAVKRGTRNTFTPYSQDVGLQPPPTRKKRTPHTKTHLADALPKRIPPNCTGPCPRGPGPANRCSHIRILWEVSLSGTDDALQWRWTVLYALSLSIVYARTRPLRANGADGSQVERREQ